MRFHHFIFLFLMSALFLNYACADKKYKNGYDDKRVKGKKRDNVVDTDEDISRSYSFEKKSEKHKWKPLESSEEEEVINYRKRKEEMKKKKTLGDVFQEKKMKKKAKKEKFKKHVLKYFEDDEESEEESSEEIVAPLRRNRLVVMDCNSMEEECD